MVPCENNMKFVKVRGTKFKKLNCKSKCVQKVLDTEADCDATCPGLCGRLGAKWECAV